MYVAKRYIINFLGTYSHTDKLQVPYHGYLRNQLSAAFDVYLLICQHVNRQINSSLGFNSENRLARLCPPCFFRVLGEAEQEFSVLVSMDGNNSLKRVKSSVRGQEERPDLREVISDRWLSAAEVNKFKDETQDTVSIIQYNWTKALIICETGV